MLGDCHYTVASEINIVDGIKITKQGILETKFKRCVWTIRGIIFQEYYTYLISSA